MPYYDSLRDPVDNSIADSYYWLSLSSTGTTTAYATTTFNDLIVPPVNFPNSTATRYLINLPGEPYYAGIDAGNSTFVIKNINTTTILTRIAPTATLTANTYKIFPATAERRGVMEVHVGSGSNSVGDVLTFHGRFISSIINGKEVGSGFAVTIATTNSQNYSFADCVITSTQDADVILNSYINILAVNGGGSIKLMDGTYTYRSATTCISNLTIEGLGHYTHFVASSGLTSTNFLVINTTNTTNVVIKKIRVSGLGNSSTSNNGIFCSTQNSNYNLLFQEIEVDDLSNGILNAINVENCIATSCSTGFNKCVNVSNSKAINCDVGFETCYNVVLTKAYSSNRGFSGCFIVQNCRSEGSTSGSFPFYGCYKMNNNVSVGTASSYLYVACYADKTGSVTINTTGADTAASGWNFGSTSPTAIY